MFDAYEYAQKFIKISNLMDECIQTIKNVQRCMNINHSIRMHSYGGKMDVLYYNDYPVLDHKIAWRAKLFNYNFVATSHSSLVDSLIVDTSTNVFYATRDDIQSDRVPHYMEFLDTEEHLFQMEIMLGERYELYCILHALHMLGYDNRAYIHVHSMNVLDRIIDDVEAYLENHYRNKEF